jgi:hypothetical protein
VIILVIFILFFQKPQCARDLRGPKSHKPGPSNQENQLPIHTLCLSFAKCAHAMSQSLVAYKEQNTSHHLMSFSFGTLHPTRMLCVPDVPI